MRIDVLTVIVLGAGVGAWFLYAVAPTYGMKAVHFIKCCIQQKDASSIVLTFDDGPSPRYTAELLDMLCANNVRATFFVVGVFAQDNPELIKRMQHDGHTIGIHSFAHENGLFMSPNKTAADAARTISALKKLGVTVRWYRPPWGHFNLSMIFCLRKFGLRPFLWDVMAQDWSAHSTAEMIESKLLKRTKAGSIICLHDGRGRNHAPSRTIAALSNVIPAWKNDGYKFETADEYGI